MKRQLLSLLAALLLGLMPVAAQQVDPQPVEPPFQEVLSKATLALYTGRQTCDYEKDEDWGFRFWSCEFTSHFVCTATVVGGDGGGDYVGLTDGHCIKEDLLDQYYVSDDVIEKPVLRKVEIKKFANDDRYDYAMFYFHSLRKYPIMHIELKNELPPVGTKVLNINFSFGVTKAMAEGTIVSGKIQSNQSARVPMARGRYLVTLPVGPGASGSPVVDEDSHKIIGLVEAIFPGTQMAAIVIPLGENFVNFLDDDSVMMHELAPPKEMPPAPPAPPSFETANKVANGILIGLAMLILGLPLYLHRTQLKATLKALVARIKALLARLKAKLLKKS